MFSEYEEAKDACTPAQYAEYVRGRERGTSHNMALIIATSTAPATSREDDRIRKASTAPGGFAGLKARPWEKDTGGVKSRADAEKMARQKGLEILSKEQIREHREMVIAGTARDPEPRRTDDTELLEI